MNVSLGSTGCQPVGEGGSAFANFPMKLVSAQRPKPTGWQPVLPSGNMRVRSFCVRLMPMADDRW